IISTFSRRDLQLLRGRAESALLNLSIHLTGKQIPTIHDATGYHNNLRVNQIDQIRKTDPEIHPHTFENRESQLISLLPGVVNLLRRQIITLQTGLRKQRHRLARHSHNRRRRRKQLQTTDVPTLALQTTKRIDSRMSNLAGRTM